MIKTSLVDTRVFVILGIFTVIFGGLGAYFSIHNPDDWKALTAISAILLPFWLGAFSVKFSFSKNFISYSSLFKKITISTADIADILIVSEMSAHAPSAPRFRIKLKDGHTKQINVRVLPLKVVREFCAMLVERGVSIYVQDSFMAKRMAAQIFPQTIQTEQGAAANP